MPFDHFRISQDKLKTTTSVESCNKYDSKKEAAVVDAVSGGTYNTSVKSRELSEMHQSPVLIAKRPTLQLVAPVAQALPCLWPQTSQRTTTNLHESITKFLQGCKYPSLARFAGLSISSVLSLLTSFLVVAVKDHFAVPTKGITISTTSSDCVKNAVVHKPTTLKLPSFTSVLSKSNQIKLEEKKIGL